MVDLTCPSYCDGDCECECISLGNSASFCDTECNPIITRNLVISETCDICLDYLEALDDAGICNDVCSCAEIDIFIEESAETPAETLAEIILRRGLQEYPSGF